MVVHLPTKVIPYQYQNGAWRPFSSVFWYNAVKTIVSAPPGGPAIGDRHIVGPGASGAFLGQEDKIATYSNAGWFFDTPEAGAGVTVLNTSKFLQYFGGWIVVSGLDSAIVSTAGGVITLDMNSQAERMFRGSANIGAIKTWALANDANAVFIPSAKFVMTTTNIQTFPAAFKMATFDANWNNATKQWTPPDVGTYEMSATFDGTNWLMKIQGPY